MQAGVPIAPGDSPAFELFRELIQDLHCLPVVVQLGVHQGRELAHLLDLQESHQAGMSGSP